MVQYTAPAPLPGTPARPASDCNDRANHDGNRHGGHKTQTYINECSSVANSPGPPYPPGRNAQFFLRSPCVGVPSGVGPAHAAPHASCGYCRINIQSLDWMRRAVERMSLPPPVTEKKGWLGFWTRLCGTCEIAEQLLIDSRLMGPLHPNWLPAVLPTVLQRNAMQDYPRNTCTCLPKIARKRVCVEHAEAQWSHMLSQVPAGALPAADQLVAERNRNMAWLRSIKNDPANFNNTSTAHGSRRSQRTLTRRYRACRCGEEVVPRALAHVFQCMACEGIRGQTPVPLPAIPAPAAFNSTNHGGQFTLGRAVLATLVR